MISIEELKNKIEELGYIATEELVYDAFNALCMFNDGKVNPGQDIYAICLEGPPGAGKTEFAKVYTKLANKIFNNVEMVDYQCDATTGKTELFEDINISAAIRGDAENVNIPGKLIDAIKRVNSGKRVVLFIDEYDKAREETDAFLLQFLQSGKINSTQHGDLQIREEFKANLQVILCKNDMREELSGPLSRRVRIIRLDYMEPNTFYKIAYLNLVDNKKDKVSEGLLNLVCLMYQHAYDNKDIYDRLPSCSEMLIALEDADRLLKIANAPQYIVYKTIVKNMFKSQYDIKTFESSLTKDKNGTKLYEVISSMKKIEDSVQKMDLNTLITNKMFANECSKYTEKTKQLEDLITEYENKFSDMEKRRERLIEEETQKILLENGKLVRTDNPSSASLFEDESAFVKRGYDIFNISNGEWIEIGSANFPHLSQHLLIEKMIKCAKDLGIKIFENGILLRSDDSKLSLIVVPNVKQDGELEYNFFASQPIIPSTYLTDISNFFEFANQVYVSHPRTVSRMFSRIINDTDLLGTYKINALIYDDNKLNLAEIDSNIYNIEFSGQLIDEKLKQFADCAVCSNINNVIDKSSKIMTSKQKVLKNE